MAELAKEERLLNLIVALSSTRHRLTRDQIRNTVAGYDPVPLHADEEESRKAAESFERKFERDKKELRELGIPVETVMDAHGDEIGYRVRPAEAALPAIELTSPELAILNLAADYWQDAVLGGDARQAVVKLTSSAEHGPRVELPFAGRATRASAAFGVLVEAVAERQPVRFEYSSASTGLATRVVEPWTVVLRQGVAYLIGFDRDREAPRTFRVQRIGGRVTRIATPGSYEIPDEIPLGLLADSGDVHTATVALRPESGHVLRRRGTVVDIDGDWDLLEIPYAHEDSVLAEVLGLGGSARIVAPPELVAAVTRHVDAALEATDG
ncbi:helix-turn-helix transcriptional regulator [Demequina pelophila]|uniref:helix-turn-helix transcriptional regulator n=1 Tax=Demequina pelophila TaxID=1638984 RepID=UPI0007855A9E|nr:WYL domain-containing protein [Demequina pelophila]